MQPRHASEQHANGTDDDRERQARQVKLEGTDRLLQQHTVGRDLTQTRERPKAELESAGCITSGDFQMMAPSTRLRVTVMPRLKRGYVVIDNLVLPARRRRSAIRLIIMRERPSRSTIGNARERRDFLVRLDVADVLHLLAQKLEVLRRQPVGVIGPEVHVEIGRDDFVA